MSPTFDELDLGRVFEQDFCLALGDGKLPRMARLMSSGGLRPETMRLISQRLLAREVDLAQWVSRVNAIRSGGSGASTPAMIFDDDGVPKLLDHEMTIGDAIEAAVGVAISRQKY